MFDESFDYARLKSNVFETDELIGHITSKDEAQAALLRLVQKNMIVRDNSRSRYATGYRLARAGVNLLAALALQDSGGETESRSRSSNWTGLPEAFELDAEKQERLSALLGDLEIALERAAIPNSEMAMARAYVIAAKVLAETPDPPADLIWELIGRANSIAGVASLLVSIIALFTAALH